MKVCGWTIREWPWTPALGERWSAFPPPTMRGDPWPGLKFFPTEEAARVFVTHWWWTGNHD